MKTKKAEEEYTEIKKDVFLAKVKRGKKQEEFIMDWRLNLGIPFEHAKNRTKLGELGKLSAMDLIQCYETEGQQILKKYGCSLTYEEFKKEKRKDRLPLQLTNVIYMLHFLKGASLGIRHKKMDFAVRMVMMAMEFAARAQINPYMPDIERGKATVEGASLGGKRRKQFANERHATWKKDAEEMRRKYPTYSSWRIAGELSAFYKKNKPMLFRRQDTIWRVIK